MLSRAQLLALGLSPAQARQPVHSNRWRIVLPGVYATFTGPLPDRSRIWAALLYAGPGSAAAGRTALFLNGIQDELPLRLEVVVPHERRVVPRPQLEVRRARGLGARISPVGHPARLRAEDAVLDVIDGATTSAAVVDVLLRAVQRRRTTPERLRAALAERPRSRWRGLIEDVLDDTAGGVRSALERRYLRHVASAHGLPRGEHNAAVEEHDAFGQPVGRRYRDVRYARWQLLVELDGHEAHPSHTRWRDRRRDNRATIAGEVSLRYGWAEVASTPCEVAAEVASVLRRHGWRGSPKPCGPACPVARQQRA